MQQSPKYTDDEGDFVTKKYDTRRIGENMYHLRKKQLRLSQEAFSERADLSRDTISNIERGCHCPNLETLVGIANAVDVSIEFFLLEAEGVEYPQMKRR